MKEKNVKGEIYIIKNNINKKVYVGQTIRGYRQRFSGHKSESRYVNRPLYNAFKKYGIDNFYVELLEDNIPYEQLDEREIYWIKFYDCVSPNGYNLSYGGYAYKTEEERQIMRERVSGENNPMFGMNGEKNPFYNHSHTEETKKILSEKAKNNYDNLSDEEKEINNKRLNEASKSYIEKYGGGFKGHNHSQESKDRISETLKGRIFTEETKQKMSENHAKKRKVVMIDDSGVAKIFDSMTIACDYLKENNISTKPKPGTISNVCLKKQKTAYGFIWIYYEDYLEGNYNLDFKRKSKPQKVICLNTEKEYNSANSASKDTGCFVSGILECCKGNYKYTKDRNGNKLKWKFVE